MRKRFSITLALLVITGLISWILGWEYAKARERRLLWEWVHPMVAEAGNTKCDMKAGQVPCNMKSCRHMAKKQMWCSPTCHNGCCACPQSCNGHNPERQQSPEEEQ